MPTGQRRWAPSASPEQLVELARIRDLIAAEDARHKAERERLSDLRDAEARRLYAAGVDVRDLAGPAGLAPSRTHEIVRGARPA